MAKKRKRKVIQKATNKVVTLDYLNHRAESLHRAGYEKPRWIIFCEVMIRDGFLVTLYEARRTVSKYITVARPDLGDFKVRFSNHRPIAARELNGDCDFFVGVTNLATTTTGQAIAAVRDRFKQSAQKE
ncbi:hypothetical protein [Phenylobacterium sp.]|uniref:hypothetical protein n=1 Tax=Phenylobacterium sp. TaxID=1871053 RepID=UPI00301E12D1